MRLSPDNTTIQFESNNELSEFVINGFKSRTCLIRKPVHDLKPFKKTEIAKFCTSVYFHFPQISNWIISLIQSNLISINTV